MKNKQKALSRKLELILFFGFWGLAFCFSFWLMFHTLSTDSETDTLRVASKAWSDFGSHIPLIRSFSHGANLTRLIEGHAPEYPHFPGLPIRYHYGFYAGVGLLERLGIPLTIAFNVPSALGFFLMLVAMYILAKRLFTDARIGIMAILFTLLNGSLSFLSFFREHPLSWHTVTDITSNSVFPSFGPWDGGFVTAFHTLNIYTNQRHLAFSFAILLAAIIVATRRNRKKQLLWRDAAIIGTLTGSLLLVNLSAIPIALIIIGWIALAKPDTRKTILLAPIFSLPWALLFLRTVGMGQHISWNPWYLVPEPHTVGRILWFWIANTGLHMLLVPLGMIIAPRAAKRLIVPLVILFILPNLFQFSRDMINNHKFFTFLGLIGSMFTATALLWIARHLPTSRIIRRGITLLLFLIVTFSGIIDLFPIINDHALSLPDSPSLRDVQFIQDATPKDAVILNSTWFYHPALLAGRSVYFGYPYFTWSYGYDKDTREDEYLSIYRADSKAEACALLTKHQIEYVELSEHPETYINPNVSLWRTAFEPIYTNSASGISIYNTVRDCSEGNI